MPKLQSEIAVQFLRKVCHVFSSFYISENRFNTDDTGHLRPLCSCFRQTKSENVYSLIYKNIFKSKPDAITFSSFFKSSSFYRLHLLS